MRLAAITAAIAATALWAGAARATTVGVLHPPSPSPVTTEVVFRLLAELRALGLEARTLDETAADGVATAGAPTVLRRLAGERGLDAVIALLGSPAPAIVDVWATDGKGRSVARRVLMDPSQEHAPQTIAIRAIELLRSCLLEMNLLGASPTAAPKARPDVPPAPPSRGAPPVVVPFEDRGQRSRFGVGVGAVGLVGLDGVGLAVLPSLRFDARLTSAWLVQAAVAGGGTRGSVEGTTGSARVAEDQVLAGIAYQVLPGRLLRPLVSVAVGALRTTIEGQALPPNQSQRVGHWSLLVDGAVGASLRLGERWELIGAAHLQAAAPYPTVRFVGRTVATSEHPSVVLGLAVETWL